MTSKTMLPVIVTLLLTLVAYSAATDTPEDLYIPSPAEAESLHYMFDIIDKVDNFQSNENINNTSGDDILTICKSFLKEYASQSSSFTKCLIENARPFRFCETCVRYYKKASTVFTDMTEDVDCSRKLLLADRVQVVRLVNKNMENIWQNAYCNDCFATISENATSGYVSYTLKNTTQEFLDLFVNMTMCLNDTMQELDPLLVVMGNFSFCDKCRTHYRSMNAHYTSMTKDAPSKVCMDMVDMMNYTRLTWSKKLHCSHRKGDLAPILVITGVICALPVIFYVANRLIKPRTERTIVIQRRMKFPYTNNSYGSMSGSQQTLVNSNSQTANAYQPSLQTSIG